MAIFFKLVVTSHINRVIRIASVDHDGRNRLDDFPVTLNVRQFRVRRSNGETNDVIALFQVIQNRKCFDDETNQMVGMSLINYLQSSWNAMKFAGSVDFFQQGLGQIVGAFQTEDDHSQVTGSRNFKTIVRFDHIFEFFG